MNVVRRYASKNGTVAMKFCAIGLVSTLLQLVLQWTEKEHGYNIYWWSLLQGSILANLGMAINKQWTFKERSLPWLWAILCWNMQKVPHSTASMVVFGLLLQVSFLPFWGATLLTAGSLGLGSLMVTIWFVDRTSVFDRWTATMVTAALLAYSLRPGAKLKTTMA